MHVTGTTKARETSKSSELAAGRLRGCSAHHAGGAPDVGRRVVVGTDQDLHRAVLTRLDVLAEVLMLMVKEEKNIFYCMTPGKKRSLCFFSSEQSHYMLLGFKHQIQTFYFYRGKPD